MSRISPFQFRCIETCSYPLLTDSRASQPIGDVPLQFFDIQRCCPGRVLIYLRPHEFHRVQLRCIPRKVLDVQPSLFSNERLHFLPLMNWRIIPHYQERSSDDFEQIFEKADDFYPADAPLVSDSSQLEPPPLWRHQQRANDVHPSVMVQTRPHHRRLPARRPRPFQRRDQTEPALINKDERRRKLTPLFLYMSTDTAASALPPCRHAVWRLFAASDNSNSSSATGARLCSGDSAPRTVHRSSAQSDLTSSTPLHSRECKRRGRVLSPTARAAWAKVEEDGPSALSGALAMGNEPPDASAEQSVVRHQLRWRPRKLSDLYRAGRERGRGERRVAEHCR